MMSTALWLAVVLIALPAFALALWPLFRRGPEVAPDAAQPAPADDRRLELTEEKASVYRAIKEIQFDYEAGHLSEEDYRPLRDRYEGRAAALIHALDALGPESLPRPARTPPVTTMPAGRHGWTRHPAILAGGAVLLLLFGVLLGINAGRFSAREQAAGPPAASMAMPPAPGSGAATPGPADPVAGSPVPAAGMPQGAITPETMGAMLQAARQSLMGGQYQQAISAYQAVLKRDPSNVDAMTHLGLIVAIGGHADSALQSFDKALTIDPNYAPAHLYRGQVLYEVKKDYPGAIKAWERFVTLVPRGQEHDQVRALIDKARSQQPAR